MLNVIRRFDAKRSCYQKGNFMSDEKDAPYDLDRRAVFHQGFCWFYEKADLPQGAYALFDAHRQKMAVILPFDKTRPIDDGRNAYLFTRNYQSEQWVEGHKILSLDEALDKGSKHGKAYCLEVVKHEGLGGMIGLPVSGISGEELPYKKGHTH